MELMWQTGHMNLIDLWERFQGYHKWMPAVALVQSTELSRVGEMGGGKSNPPLAVGWESICKIRWQDQNQIERSAVFKAFEDSPLYQLIEGDTVNIRFNPANPSEYYLPGLIKSGLSRAWQLTLYTMMLILLGILVIVCLFAH